MSTPNRQNTYAIAKGATWDTLPTLGANSQMLPQSISGLERQIANAPDQAAGHGLTKNSVQGPDMPVTPNFSLWLYETDYITLLLTAMFFGNDTVTGVGDPYTHTMVLQETANYFYGMGYEAASENRSITSALIESITETYEGDAGILTHAYTCKGTKSHTAGSILGSATCKTFAAPFLMQNTTLWINNQSEGALDYQNEIEVTDLQITFNRPSDSVHATGNSVIMQPIQGGYPDMTISFKIPLNPSSTYNPTESQNLYDDFVAGTLKKIEITNSGTTADRERKLYLPEVFLTNVTEPTEEIISCQVEGRIQVADSNPTGMANTAPYITWKTDVTTSPIA